MLTPDSIIIQGLKGSERERHKQEEVLYKAYEYLITEGCRKYHLTREDSSSAYDDAFLSVVDNIIHDHFDGHATLKTYFSKIFYNKCIDQGRKNATNKNEVHKAAQLPEMMINQLPDSAKTIIEAMMTQELKNEVLKHLQTIGDKCKEILLRYQAGATDKEIAEELSYNNAAVAKTTRLRCLEKLRAKMQSR